MKPQVNTGTHGFMARFALRAPRSLRDAVVRAVPVRALACLCLVILLTACGSDANQPGEGTTDVYVSAAASTTDVVTELAALYENEHDVRVRLNFAASSLLARQIDDGAPAGVYISAHREWVDYLAEKGLASGEPVMIAGNRLVCVTRKDAEIKPGSLDELAGSGIDVAVADEGVPAGEYTRQALGKAGVLDRLGRQLIAQRDVRAAALAVADGHVHAGVVYATDAAAYADKLEVAFTIDANLHDPVRYYAVRVKRAESPKQADAFFEYLQGEEARAKLKALGFSNP